MDFAERLALALADDFDGDRHATITEAYEFDRSAADELLGTAHTERDASVAEVEVLRAEVAALKDEVLNVKAMNFDKLMAGGEIVDDEIDKAVETDEDYADISIDDLFDNNEEKEDA